MMIDKFKADTNPMDKSEYWK